MKNTSKRDPLIESIIEGLMTGRQSEVLKNVYSRRVPLLRYKMNDSVIKFKGQRIPVEDLFKFIKRGDSYLPKFSTKEEKGDRVIDMTPFICVGVSELLQVVASDTSTGAFDEEIDEIFGRVFLNIEELNTVLNKICICSEDLSAFGVAPIIYNMTSSYIDYRFPNIKKLATQLLVLVEHLLLVRSY